MNPTVDFIRFHMKPVVFKCSSNHKYSSAINNYLRTTKKIGIIINSEFGKVQIRSEKEDIDIRMMARQRCF